MNVTDQVRRLRRHAIGKSPPNYAPAALRLDIISNKQLKKEADERADTFIYSSSPGCAPSFMGMPIILEHDGLAIPIRKWPPVWPTFPVLERPIVCIEMRSPNPARRVLYFDYDKCFPPESA